MNLGTWIPYAVGHRHLHSKWLITRIYEQLKNQHPQAEKSYNGKLFVCGGVSVNEEQHHYATLGNVFCKGWWKITHASGKNLCRLLCNCVFSGSSDTGYPAHQVHHSITFKSKDLQNTKKCTEYIMNKQNCLLVF